VNRESNREEWLPVVFYTAVAFGKGAIFNK